MAEYILVDEVITDLEDVSDNLSELGTTLGDGDFEGTVALLDAQLQTLNEIRTWLEERDSSVGDGEGLEKSDD